MVKNWTLLVDRDYKTVVECHNCNDDKLFFDMSFDSCNDDKLFFDMSFDSCKKEPLF